MVAPAAIVPPPARPPAPVPPATPFVVPAGLSSYVPPFVPPPLPTPARPTPPSGTSPVTSPVEAPQREEEDEAAPESVSAEAVAYRPAENEPTSAYLIGIVVLAAFAGASIRGRPSGRRRPQRIAPATMSTLRRQRALTDRDRRRP